MYNLHVKLNYQTLNLLIITVQVCNQRHIATVSIDTQSTKHTHTQKADVDPTIQTIHKPQNTTHKKKKKDLPKR